MLIQEATEGGCASELSAAPRRGGRPTPGWAEARRIAFECASPLPSESVALESAGGRTAARDVSARQDIPHYASSAMDGWAVSGPGPWTLAEQGQALSPGQAATIATGGLVPPGACSILRKESGRLTRDPDGTRLLTLHGHALHGEPKPGRHIRPAGEEAAAGEVLIPAGTVLNPAHIALAAVAGHDELQVNAKPLVAIVLTGSEVVTSGVPAPGQVRDTFGPQLGTVISLLGAVPHSPLRIGDSYDEWLSALGASKFPAGRRPDVTITTGGTGKSGTDHFRAAVNALGGRLLVDGIAMRPGHPAVLAELADGRFVVGLPGNPLAAMMALATLAEPLLAALGGRSPAAAGDGTSGVDLDPDPGRTSLLPCRSVDGLAVPVPYTGPGMMRGLAWADGVMAVPPAGVRAGDPIPVLPLPWTQSNENLVSARPRARSAAWHE